MMKGIMLFVGLALWPLTLWASSSNAGGLPTSLTDQLNQLQAQLSSVQKDLAYVKERVSPEPVGMTVCGSSEIFAEGDFTSSGHVEAGGDAGPEAELLYTKMEGKLSGSVANDESSGVGAGTHSAFEVCVDLGQLAAVIEAKQAAGQPLTDLETFAYNLYKNSASVEQRLLTQAKNRLNAQALTDPTDSANPLYGLGDQIDYLDQNLSDAQTLPMRIQMVAVAGALVPLPSNLRTRLSQPWGVVPTVSDLTNSCNVLQSTLNESVCGDIQNLGGLTLSELNSTVNTIQSKVDSVSDDVTNDYNDTTKAIKSLSDTVNSISNNLFGGGGGGGGGSSCTVFSSSWWEGNC